MFILFSPNFVLYKMDQYQQKVNNPPQETVARCKRNSTETQNIQSHIPTGKRKSSLFKSPDLLATGKRKPGSSFSNTLRDQYFDCFAIRGSTQISNILKTPKVFSALLWVFCYLSFCLKRFGRLSEIYCALLSKNHREIV